MEPLIPGTRVRFQRPEAVWAQDYIRDRVQDGGPHLYVFGLPFLFGGARPLCVVECYEPWQMRTHYWDQLDPYRRADWQAGNLIALSPLPLRGTFRVGGNSPGAVDAFWPRGLDERTTDEIRRNNRNARADLKRTSSAHARKLALQGGLDEAEAPIFQEFSQVFEDAYHNSLEYMKPKNTPRGRFQK